MFCNQCEQTSKGTGCTSAGVCGKKPETAALQDVLSYTLRELAPLARAAREKGQGDTKLDHFVLEALFMTLTNVNFDDTVIDRFIRETMNRTVALKTQLGSAAAEKADHIVFHPSAHIAELVNLGEQHAGLEGLSDDEDIRSLKQLLLYGVRGAAAYAYHARLLGKEDDAVYAFIYDALTAVHARDTNGESLLGLVLKCGEINLRAMELLDNGHVEKLGHPEPTRIQLGPKKGKCILISGHDLLDLKRLLEMTEGKGINIYTHGEMLPAHAYPELKKYKHLVGHYGTAWQNQKKEFAAFPGAILMTTNCIQAPQPEYVDRIFTTGPVGWPDVSYVENGAFEPVIAKALELQGFPEDKDMGSVMGGFARNAVLGVADKIIEGVKSGAIKHFFLVAGCDGSKPGRNYYTEFVEKAPKDTVILTLACGKFRFFDKDLGDIGGIPRLLDVGQCNDAYSAVQIALALANAFECGVNDLPLSMVLSWYEQKAVSILLTLLYLGIKDIRLGPSLPAFISPGVLKVLVESYGIRPITTADEDLKAILG
ncbi:MAG: hydroxylamine reductase [Solirubrobacterales bacterium]